MWKLVRYTLTQIVVRLAALKVRTWEKGQRPQLSLLHGQGLLCSEILGEGDKPAVDHTESQEESARLCSFPPQAPGSSLGTGRRLVWRRVEKTTSKSGFFWLLAYRFKSRTGFTCRFILPVITPLFVQPNTRWWLCSCSLQPAACKCRTSNRSLPSSFLVEGRLRHRCRNVLLARHQMETPNQSLSCLIRT